MYVLQTRLTNHGAIKERYNVKVNFLVLSGLPSSLKSLRETNKDSHSTNTSQNVLERFQKAKKG